jgi:hypothetical protein
MWNPNNSFLYDNLAIDGAEVQEEGLPNVQAHGVLGAVGQQQNYLATSSSFGTHNIKLLEFWLHSPAM